MPGCDLTTRCIDIAESSRKALAGEHGELACRHVESAAVFGRVVELELAMRRASARANATYREP